MPGRHVVRDQRARPGWASLTERARREMCRRVGRDGHSVAQWEVPWPTSTPAAVTLAATVAVEVLLDAAAASVQRVTGQPDDVKGVHERHGIG